MIINQTEISPISQNSKRDIFSQPNIPLDVSTELNGYYKIFVCKRFNPFRVYCCLEAVLLNYEIFGELPDGDKKLLFTSQQHVDDECCNCCKYCTLECYCCRYVCNDLILFQMDYKRNDKNFYTQGIYLKKGCYCWELYCYYNLCNCCKITLYLKENTDPYGFNSGIGKGKTNGTPGCCIMCRDKVATYYSNEENQGPKIRYKFNICDLINNICCHYCCCCVNDIIIDILDEKEQRVGNILVPNGCNSEKVHKSCYLSGKYYEINLPSNASSIEKFQIIADVIHLDLEHGLL